MSIAPPHLRTIRSRFSGLLGRLRRDERGISVVEFAISLPIFSALAMYGLEIAYMSVVNMQISQLALSVADNASRLGQTDNSAVPPTIAETDIDAVLGGGIEQGKRLNFQANGRIILSSLERHSNGKQYIHWQRCKGNLTSKASSYGNETTNNGLTGAVLTGMGRTGKQVTAGTNSPVMYAEVYYTYQPLFGRLFVGNNMLFKQEAAFLVRDDRSLGEGQRGTTGTVTSAC